MLYIWPAGMVRVMDNDDHIGPFNIGNPGARSQGLRLRMHALQPGMGRGWLAVGPSCLARGAGLTPGARWFRSHHCCGKLLHKFGAGR